VSDQIKLAYLFKDLYLCVKCITVIRLDIFKFIVSAMMYINVLTILTILYLYSNIIVIVKLSVISQL